jgi:hypothetical protein
MDVDFESMTLSQLKKHELYKKICTPCDPTKKNMDRNSLIREYEMYLILHGYGDHQCDRAHKTNINRRWGKLPEEGATRFYATIQVPANTHSIYWPTGRCDRVTTQQLVNLLLKTKLIVDKPKPKPPKPTRPKTA